MEKTILITGCSSGIGLGCAVGLRARGWRVIACCRHPDDVARLSDDGFECLALDLSDEASVEATARSVLELTGGRLDAVFHNAGYGQTGAVEDLAREAVRAQFETNLFGPWSLTRRLLPAMRGQQSGRIVFNSSIFGFCAMKYRGAYIASKYAIEGLCDTLRLELSGSGIHVSLIEPGPIESRFRANALPHFLNNVDVESSVHCEAYQAQLQRLKKIGAAAPFTLPPEAVLDCLLHALQSSHPRPRYRVTRPSRLFWYLKRWLPVCWMDRILLSASR